MNAAHVTGTFLAGLGLFFTGLTLLSGHLTRLAGPRLRRIISRYTNTDLRAHVVGLCIGLIVQSISATTLLLSGLVANRLLTVRRGMAVLSAANVGLCLVIFIAVLDIRLFVLYLLGLAGLCFAFNRNPARSSVIGAILGVSLLYFGLHMMRTGTGPLQEWGALQQLLTATRDWHVLAFLAGTLITLLLQSSVAVSLMIIALAYGGLLSAEQSIMAIYGSNLGSGVVTWLLASSMKGTARQLSLYVVYFKCIGAAVAVPLFYIELWTGWPLLIHLTGAITQTIEYQLAFSMAAFNVIAALFMIFLYGPVQNSLNRFAPITAQENLSRTQYLQEGMQTYADTALDLVEREQLRLISYFPHFLVHARSTVTQHAAEMSLQAWHDSYVSVSGEIRTYLREIVDHGASHETSHRMLKIENQLYLLNTLESTLLDFVHGISQRDEKLLQKTTLIDSMVEALDMLLVTTHETLDTRLPDDLDELKRMTNDHGETMERIRNAHMNSDQQLASRPARAHLLYLTHLFERMVWNINQLARLQSS